MHIETYTLHLADTHKMNKIHLGDTHRNIYDASSINKLKHIRCI